MEYLKELLLLKRRLKFTLAQNIKFMLKPFLLERLSDLYPIKIFIVKLQFR